MLDTIVHDSAGVENGEDFPVVHRHIIPKCIDEQSSAVSLINLDSTWHASEERAPVASTTPTPGEIAYNGVMHALKV